MGEPTNSAQRLYDILNQVHIRGGDPNSAKMNIGAFLRDTIYLKNSEEEEKDEISKYIAYSELLRLAQQVRTDIKSIDLQDNIVYLESVQNVLNSIARGTHRTQLTQFQSLIPEHLVESLRFCASALVERQHIETIVDQHLLDELLDSINSFLNDLVSSKLPTIVKENLITHLENVRRSVITYRLRGASGLSEAIDGSVGYMMRYHLDPSIDKGNASEETAQDTKNFWDIITKASNIITLAQAGNNFGPVLLDIPNLIKGLLL